MRPFTDMDRKDIAWISLCLLLVPLGVAETTDPWIDFRNIPGRLVFYQMQGNISYIRDTGELASDVQTEIMFELLEHHINYSTSSFTYTWDLGNGEVIRGTEPVVHYHYPQSGNYTLCLTVGGNTTKYAPPIAGFYSTNVQVLDAIREIQLKDPSYYEVSQNTALAFYVDGSPPMWVCWRFVHNCLPDVSGGCTLSMLYENTLRLNHTFTDPGPHCLDVSVRNDISKLQSSFSLNVKGNYKTHVIYILSSAAVFVTTIAFIAAITCHRRRHSRSQIAASGNGIFLESRDTEPLLLHYGTQYSS